MTMPGNVAAAPRDWLALKPAPAPSETILCAARVRARLWFDARAAAMRLFGCGPDVLEVTPLAEPPGTQDRSRA